MFDFTNLLCFSEKEINLYHQTILFYFILNKEKLLISPNIYFLKKVEQFCNNKRLSFFKKYDCSVKFHNILK